MSLENPDPSSTLARVDTGELHFIANIPGMHRARLQPGGIEEVDKRMARLNERYGDTLVTGPAYAQDGGTMPNGYEGVFVPTEVWQQVQTATTQK